MGFLDFISSAPAGVTDTVKSDPFAPHWISGASFKLHRLMGTALFLCACAVFFKEAVGEHIHCIQDSSAGDRISPAAFDSYCYISDTFTLPPEGVTPKGGSVQTYPGVGPYSSKPLARTRQQDQTYHNYYQWISYLLFLQSLSFFLPYTLFRLFQDGRLQQVLQGLNNLVLFHETRQDRYGDIALFMRDWYNKQSYWAMKLVLVDALNLLNIILNIFLVDWYLGHTFFPYGPTVLSHMIHDDDDWSDPMELVFPSMTKCTLNSFGPSGTIQNHDALCVMPVNVLNEKIYFLLWFAMFALALFTLVHHVVSAVIMFFGDLRKRYLLMYVSPDRRSVRKKLSQLLDLTGFGDWMLLLLFARNTDRVVFSELIEALKFPDYDWDLEPLDRENRELVDRRARGEWNLVKNGDAKKRRYFSGDSIKSMM